MTLTYLNKQTKYTNTENHSLIQDSPSSEMFLDYPSYPLAYYTVAREVLGNPSDIEGDQMSRAGDADKNDLAGSLLNLTMQRWTWKSKN